MRPRNKIVNSLLFAAGCDTRGAGYDWKLVRDVIDYFGRWRTARTGRWAVCSRRQGLSTVRDARLRVVDLHKPRRRRAGGLQRAASANCWHAHVNSLAHVAWHHHHQQQQQLYHRHHHLRLLCEETQFDERSLQVMDYSPVGREALKTSFALLALVAAVLTVAEEHSTLET